MQERIAAVFDFDDTLSPDSTKFFIPKPRVVYYKSGYFGLCSKALVEEDNSENATRYLFVYFTRAVNRFA